MSLEGSFVERVCSVAINLQTKLSETCPASKKVGKIEAKKLKFFKKKQNLEKLLRQNPTQELVTVERQEILSLGIIQLIQKLKSGVLDPLAVMEAYQARALEATEKTNCIVDFLDESRDEAIALRSVPLDQRGPLFGIPFSVKECFFVKGYDSTAGLTKYINMPVQEDATYVKGKVIGIHSNTGFMSSSVDGVIVGMRAILTDPLKMSEMDYKAVPLPWREELFNPKRKLKIGWYDDDGYFPATPCCRRAVHEATSILARLGHEVVAFRPPGIRDIVLFYFNHMLADSGITSLEVWQDEILDQTSDMWKSMMKLDDAIEAIFTAWQDQNIDVLICPGFTYPAPPITNPGRIVPAISYPAVYNVLDFPAGVVPVTRVNEADQAALESYPKNDDLLYKLVYQGTLGTQGFPLGVQVVGKPWCEELVLHVMKILEENRDGKFP